jgi:carboxyl-terminal processing protease
MKKKRNRLFDILIAVLVSCFIGMISGGAAIVTMNYNKEASIANNTSSFEEIKDIYKKIMGEYYESVDEKDLVQGAISGMLSVLDANSSFLDESKTTSFNNKMQGEYYGIGIEALSIEDSGVLVVTVVGGSPADKAGIKEGDIITKVNGVSLLNKTANYFTSLVASLKDNIKIKILRDTDELEFTLSAEKIIIESVTTNTFYKNICICGKYCFSVCNQII